MTYIETKLQQLSYQYEHEYEWKSDLLSLLHSMKDELVEAKDKIEKLEDGLRMADDRISDCKYNTVICDGGE